MPELPEVETTRRGIEPHIIGKSVKTVVVRQPVLRWPVPMDLSAILSGQKLKSLSRRGKYLLLAFANGHVLIHLGMSGSLRIVTANSALKKHDHIDIVFSSTVILRFHDPRRFGAILWTQEPLEQHALLSHLGPEPLSDEFTEEYLFHRSRKRKKDIKTFIMDASIVVGVGNIYANEALFAAGIRPTKAAFRVTRQQCGRLVKEIKYVLERSIKQGGTTLRDFVGGDGQPGYFVQQLNVYGRESKPCKQCGAKLKSIRQAQRATVYCSRCQS